MSGKLPAMNALTIHGNPVPAEQLLGQLHWRYATKQFDPNRKIDAHTWSALEEALTLSRFERWAPTVGLLSLSRTRGIPRQKLAPASFGQPEITAASRLIVFAARTDPDRS